MRVALNVAAAMLGDAEASHLRVHSLLPDQMLPACVDTQLLQRAKSMPASVKLCTDVAYDIQRGGISTEPDLLMFLLQSGSTDASTPTLTPGSCLVPTWATGFWPVTADGVSKESYICSATTAVISARQSRHSLEFLVADEVGAGKHTEPNFAVVANGGATPMLLTLGSKLAEHQQQQQDSLCDTAEFPSLSHLNRAITCPELMPNTKQPATTHATAPMALGAALTSAQSSADSQAVFAYKWGQGDDELVKSLEWAGGSRVQYASTSCGAAEQVRSSCTSSKSSRISISTLGRWFASVGGRSRRSSTAGAMSDAVSCGGVECRAISQPIPRIGRRITQQLEGSVPRKLRVSLMNRLLEVLRL